MKQRINKVIEILEDESENFKHRRAAALDCARRVSAEIYYKDDQVKKALHHLQRGTVLDVLEAIRILK